MTAHPGSKQVPARRTWGFLLAAGIVVAVAALTAATSGDKAPAVDRGPAHGPEPGEVREFWTPERLDQVEPMEMPLHRP